MRFNPRARRETRATNARKLDMRVEYVSIHARVVRRARPSRAAEGERVVHVSIHARVVRRARLCSTRSSTPPLAFQSTRAS